MSKLDRSATYTYATVRPFDEARIVGLRGVDGAPVRLLGYRGVVAAVSTAVPATLDEAVLRDRLERPDELEAIARSHHAVVEALRVHAVTLPFRLATIHHGEARVIDMLRSQYEHLDAALHRLSGHVELGVKVFVDDAASPLSPAHGPTGSPERVTSGRGYLRLRREQRQSRDEAWRRSSAAATHVDTAMRALAVSSCYHQLRHRQLCGDRGDNVLNAAYLIDVGLVEEFTARADGLDAALAGARVEVTGPWAPYSFVDDNGP